MGIGRLWPDAERWVGDFVTVVTNDGSIISGRCRRISSTRLTLEDAAGGDLRGVEMHISREEIRFVARAPDAVPVPTPTPDEPAPGSGRFPSPDAVPIRHRETGR